VQELVTELYKEELFEPLLHEDASIATRRKVATGQLDALKRAKKIIQVAELKELAGDL
jgi:hypothetical protein